MLESFKNWATAPFASTISPLDWFKLFGFLIVLAILWGLIIRMIKDIAE